jgi:hypothetical protein
MLTRQDHQAVHQRLRGLALNIERSQALLARNHEVMLMAQDLIARMAAKVDRAHWPERRDHQRQQ